MTVADEKQAIRERVWALLDEHHAVVPPGARGHVPSFVGADDAADQLAQLPEWEAAHVVKANPDQAQLPVRVRALMQHKLVYMAVPAMATERPFYQLDPAQLTGELAEAATSQYAAQVAPTVSPDAMQPVDLVVCGSVAVNREGVRLGKGAGYSDLEVALLIEAGRVTDQTTIVTTVHTLQVVDGHLPEANHDFRVDYIVTPSEVIRCSKTLRPPGLVWESLSQDKIEAIPVLKQRAQ
jgi:5-formyltetrahydrofolate cyclo-ligase